MSDHAFKLGIDSPFKDKTGVTRTDKRTISKAWATIRTAMSFFPLLRPFIIREFVRRSMMGHWALRKRLIAYRPAEWEM